MGLMGTKSFYENTVKKGSMWDQELQDFLAQIHTVF